jgi:hypothetical protein
VLGASSNAISSQPQDGLHLWRYAPFTGVEPVVAILQRSSLSTLVQGTLCASCLVHASWTRLSSLLPLVGLEWILFDGARILEDCERRLCQWQKSYQSWYLRHARVDAHQLAKGPTGFGEGPLLCDTLLELGARAAEVSQ